MYTDSRWVHHFYPKPNVWQRVWRTKPTTALHSVKAVARVEPGFGRCVPAKPWRARAWIYNDWDLAMMEPGQLLWGNPRSMLDSCHATPESAKKTMSAYVRARLG